VGVTQPPLTTMAYDPATAPTMQQPSGPSYPQGQYPPSYPANYPPGQYPPGQYPPSYPQGQYPPRDPGLQPNQGQYAQDQYAQDQYAQGQYAQGQYAQGQYAQGQYAQGQYAQGQYPPGQAPGESGYALETQEAPPSNRYRSTTGLDLRRRASTWAQPVTQRWQAKSAEGSGMLANFLLPLLILSGVLGAIWWGASLAAGRSRGPSWNIGSLFPRSSSSVKSLDGGNNADQYISWGLTKSKQGATTEAITEYERALEVNPKDVRALVNRGVAQYKSGKLDAAYGDYRAAIDLDPPAAQLAIAHNNISHVLFDQGKIADALKSAQRATELSPNLGIAWINLANAQLATKEFRQAFESYNKALANPLDQVQMAGARNNRGNALLAMGSSNSAVEDYNGALKLRPNYAEAYFNRGLAFRSEFAKTPGKAEYARIAADDFDKAAQLFDQQGAGEDAKDARTQKQLLSANPSANSLTAPKTGQPK
jgi:tetratricopeptide (TPR) repeat protein